MINSEVHLSVTSVYDGAKEVDFSTGTGCLSCRQTLLKGSKGIFKTLIKHS